MWQVQGELVDSPPPFLTVAALSNSGEPCFSSWLLDTVRRGGWGGCVHVVSGLVRAQVRLGSGSGDETET